MANLPNFDLTTRMIDTWSAALLAQASVWNNAWLKITNPKASYGLKDWLADFASSVEVNYDAVRELVRFDNGRVDWKQVWIGPNQKKSATFELSLTITNKDQIRVTKAAALGSGAKGTVDVVVSEVAQNSLVLDVSTDDEVVTGDQWIAFAYEPLESGPPLGIVLILIENPVAPPESSPAAQLAALARKNKKNTPAK